MRPNGVARGAVGLQPDGLHVPEMAGHDVVDRRPFRCLVDRGPATHRVRLRRIDLLAGPEQGHVGDAATRLRGDIERVG